MTTALKGNLIQPRKDTTSTNTIISRPSFRYIQTFKAVLVRFDLNHITNVTLHHITNVRCSDPPQKYHDNQMSWLSCFHISELMEAVLPY